ANDWQTESPTPRQQKTMRCRPELSLRDLETYHLIGSYFFLFRLEGLREGLRMVAAAMRDAIARRASAKADLSLNRLKAQLASWTYAWSSKASCAGLTDGRNSFIDCAYAISCCNATIQALVSSAI